MLKSLKKKSAENSAKINDELAALKTQIEELKNLMLEDRNQYTERVTMYSDASNDSKENICGYGIVAVPYNGDAVEFSGIVEAPRDDISVNACFGEVFAAVKAIEIAWENGYNNVLLFTDCLEVFKWKSFSSEVNNPVTQWLYEEMSSFEANMKIEIKWMKRCSCCNNTRADKLARTAMREERQRKMEEESRFGRRICTLGELVDFSKLKLAE